MHRNHDFTVLWVGQTVNLLGTRVSMFVFPLVAYALTGSALLAGLAGAAELLGTALALLPAGVVADRVDRRRVLRWAAGSGVVLYASLVVAVALDALTLAHLLVVGVLTGAAAGLFAPAENAAIPAVVPTSQLPSALSRNAARERVADLVGGPLGGALYAVGRAAPFLFDAVTFALAWVLLGRLRTDLRPTPRTSATRGSARRDLIAGFRFVWSRPLFRTLAVWGMGANLAVNAVFVAATLRLVQDGFPAWQIGLVETAAGLSGIAGAVVAPRLIACVRTGRLTVVVAWSFVPLLLPMVCWSHPAVVAAALALGVFLNPAGNAGIAAYRMSVTPPELVGRVQSVSQFLSWSTMPLAPVLAGALLAGLGGRATVAALAVLTALVALLPTLSRAVRDVPRPDAWAAQADWTGAGGRQRLPAGAQAQPRLEGAAGDRREPAGAAPGHP
nr:MFS transporter [Nocardioides flavescens]